MFAQASKVVGSVSTYWVDYGRQSNMALYPERNANIGGVGAHEAVHYFLRMDHLKEPV